MEELRSKKKYDPTAVQEVINNAKARGIKIVQGGRKRKAVNKMHVKLTDMKNIIIMR